MGQAYTDRMRIKHYLRNTINQEVTDMEMQTQMMKLLQSMEKSDHKDKQLLNRIVEQNRMAARSVTKWELKK